MSHEEYEGTEKDFGDILRELRERKGYTVNQLGIYSGVSAGLISKLENKKRGTPKPDTIEKLAKGLKMEYKDLMKLAGYVDADYKLEEDLEAHMILSKMRERYKSLIKDPDISNELKGELKAELEEWSELTGVDEFMDDIELSDDHLLEKYNFTYKGETLDSEKVKKILSYIRFVAQEK
ncbi:helix-turn-helix domain-containing protein [Paenibacillus lutrae]|uniref:Helix-turn-helix domain-containing protein n=1 Tax=Paenibacillus lutrae TaxID=2078573 RepID=A0A7X3FIG8_9BACL|nr:helix-turn-helix transcriptional regulator [Paenibacillus lutrae]MVP00391.1 helix-turn-helix domain-containing protein [Paenibacillus lutrae]